MRAVLLALLVFSGHAFAEDRAESYSVWFEKQKVVAAEILSEGGWENCLTLTISPADNIFCAVLEKGDGSRELLMTDGFIRLFRSRDEWAAAIAHEAGHAVLNHKPALKRAHRVGPFGIILWDREYVFRDIPLLERQEAEADAFAMESLASRGYDPCANQALLKRAAEAAGEIFAQDPVIIRRIELMSRVCGAAP